MIIRKQFRQILEETKVIDFPSIAGNSSNDQTITVPGARAGDVINFGVVGTPTAGICYMAFCASANTVVVRACNCTAGAIDLASTTFRVQVLQLN